MKFIPLLTYSVAILFITGCNRIKVSSVDVAAYPFPGIATYQWSDASSEVLSREGTCLIRELQQAINNELAARGWKEVLNADDASVQVTYYLELKNHHEFTETVADRDSEFSGGLVFDRNDKKWIYEERAPDQIIYEVEIGTVHVLLYDTETGKEIWHGTAKAEIDRSMDSEKSKDLYNIIARKLIHELPN